MQGADAISFVATRHSGEDLKFTKKNSFVSIIFSELQLDKSNQNYPSQT